MSDQLNPDHFTFDNQDQNYLKVEPVSPYEQQTSPLVRNALGKAVRARRQARGDEEIKIEFSPPVKYEMTEEECIKRERRKKQNREAAKRCRIKKKHGQNGTNEKLAEHEMVKCQLENEVAALREEVKHLQAMLNQHMTSGNCVHGSHNHVAGKLTNQYTNQDYDSQFMTLNCGPLVKTQPEVVSSSVPYSGDQNHFYSDPPTDDVLNTLTDMGVTNATDNITYGAHASVTDQPDTRWIHSGGVALNNNAVSVQGVQDDDNDTTLTMFTNLTNFFWDDKNSGNVNMNIWNLNQQRDIQNTPTDFVGQNAGIDTSDAIMGSDLSLHDPNRVTPDVIHEDESLYQTRTDPIKEPVTSPPIAILGSLDELQLNELVMGNIDLTPYVRKHI